MTKNIWLNYLKITVDKPFNRCGSVTLVVNITNSFQFSEKYFNNNLFYNHIELIVLYALSHYGSAFLNNKPQEKNKNVQNFSSGKQSAFAKRSNKFETKN